jgi:hypothetical protein
MEEILYYNTVTQAYSVPTKITLDIRCNGITIRNAGASTLLFDDEPIQPGQSKMIGGNRAELMRGRHDISFTGAGANLAFVTQKYYVDLTAADPTYLHSL